MIIILVISAGIALKPKKVGPIFPSFNLCPSFSDPCHPYQQMTANSLNA